MRKVSFKQKTTSKKTIMTAVLAASSITVIAGFSLVSAATQDNQQENVVVPGTPEVTKDQKDSDATNKSTKATLTQDQDGVSASLTVNGQPVVIPENGSVRKEVKNEDGSETDVHVTNNSNTRVRTSVGSSNNSTKVTITTHTSSSDDSNNDSSGSGGSSKPGMPAMPDMPDMP